MSETKKIEEVSKVITVPEEEYNALKKERDDYKNAFEANRRETQAIIEEKAILISVLVEKIKNMASR